MNTRTALAFSTLALLTACSASRPLVGQMERSNESFNGTISGEGYSGGTGRVTLVSGKATCSGDFVYTSRRRGEGVLKCDDGRTGAFHVAGAGSTGSGYGDLDGRRFTFTFNAGT